MSLPIFRGASFDVAQSPFALYAFCSTILLIHP
jgi:hypothetical protein